ncbi:exopolysaccharide biosynthesis polyprenyl glycosylphosphotransferase [Futiania mangrovi]|uniref:Exopolysaccharide biosynthesis polyprenyl glycosylphosphotransferase n=1 Tax=Futiania mangrovi TaxID=2959716 RepID=A0A9J6PB51_9PROT|nr:exopolysaccharide biosynthesis polyprenyl glycosylphosphotransferase [Futiania mangrovii]MCP1335358.1 exopolysaccharide biosynthesis polyprenyl glycosylphosphotransferase [Futiania mangrovii]
MAGRHMAAAVGGAAGTGGAGGAAYGQERDTPGRSAAEGAPGAVCACAVRWPARIRAGLRAYPAVLLGLTDAVAILAAGAAARGLYNVAVLGEAFGAGQTAVAGAVVVLAYLAVARARGVFDVRDYNPYRFAYGRVAGSVFVAMLIAVAVLFLAKLTDGVSRGWIAGWAALAVAGVPAVRFGVFSLLHGPDGRRRLLAQRALVVAETQGLAQQAAGALGISRDVAVAEALTPCAAGGVAALVARVRAGVAAHMLDEVVVAATPDRMKAARALAEALGDLPVQVRVCVTGTGLRARGARLLDGGAVELSLAQGPRGRLGYLVKSLGDRVLAAVLLVLLAPVLAAIALAIRIEGRGPVLFSQARHGFNENVIRVWKFRTMTVVEDGPVIAQARVGDPRITGVGRVLRRRSLDELPQLWNVLKGEMSLVGPRPHAIAHNSAYGRMIARYAGRHRVKPGITGWAQVQGFRGETRDVAAMQARIACDLHYIENWSLLLDLRVLFLTVLVAWRQEGAR